MKYLLIDTSTSKAQVALADEERVFDSIVFDSLQNLSVKLLPNIEKILETNKIDTDDSKGIIVYLGPGTYTGLRIGITTANALAYSLDIPIVGVKGKSLGKEKFEIKDLKPIDLEELYQKGVKELSKKDLNKIVVPFYGKEPNVSK